MTMFNPPHPGRGIKEHLDHLGLTITAYAKIINVSPSTVQRVIAGKSAISPELAAKLSKTIGGSAGLWLRMQASYDAWQIEHNSKIDFSELKPLFSSVDIHAN